MTPRGHHQAPAFTTALIARMNTRQNARKGDWLKESYETRRTGLIEEAYEAWKEAYALEDTEGEERIAVLRRLVAEAEDAGVESLMLWDRARVELEELTGRRVG